jgi:biopolymer transport protein TolR
MAFGRLERVRPRAPMSDINVTPLVDVMLVLLVIFILTAPLLTSAIRLDLPKAEGAQVGQAPLAVTLVVNNQGQVFLNDQAVRLPELAMQLTAMATQRPDTEVQLRADQAVPYGRVVEVMGVAQKAGLSRIGFVADAPARGLANDPAAFDPSAAPAVLTAPR